MNTGEKGIQIRARIEALVAEQPRTTAELAEALGMQVNATRFHVRALIRRGVLVWLDAARYRRRCAINPDPADAAPEPEEIEAAVREIEIAPGHRVIRFGRGWRPGPDRMRDTRPPGGGLSSLARNC